MHWLTSQALFPVRVDGVDNDGVIDPDDQLTRLGYNCLAITALVCLLLVIALVTVCIGWFRRFDVCLGEMGNSLVISAACHPPGTWSVESDGDDDTNDMGTKELSWGDVTVVMQQEVDEKSQEQGIEAVRHCSFAPMVPNRLLVGHYYA